MAKFIGSKEEFSKYFIGYCKNKVNAITRNKRVECNKTCQSCKKQGVELDSAHKYGYERKKIMNDILNDNFKVDNNTYFVDLNEFEKLFVEKQTPIETYFYFLCKNCHTAYDKGELSDEQILKNLKTNHQTYSQQTNNTTPFFHTPPCQPLMPTINTNFPPEIYRGKTETIQNYIKRLLDYLSRNNMISDEEYLRLQNKEYCKMKFYIEYALLQTDKNKIYDNSGRIRYWLTYKLSNKYYVCSQWWKQYSKIYESSISSWAEQVVALFRKA